MPAAVSSRRPAVYLWEGGGFGVGPIQNYPDVHDHHAFQLAFMVTGAIRFRPSQDEAWQEFEAVVLSPNQPHAMEGEGLVAQLFVEPESLHGRWLRASYPEGIAAIPPERAHGLLPEFAECYERPFEGARVTALLERVVRAVCHGPPPLRRPDPRITRALAHIRGVDVAKLSLEEAAAGVFLSPSRFAHLFRQETGLPFRRYLLWRKLSRALVLIGQGQTFTAAAHRAGFADSAHLTRTFHQMFGLPPTAMLGQMDFYEITAPQELSGLG